MSCYADLTLNGAVKSSAPIELGATQNEGHLLYNACTIYVIYKQQRANNMTCVVIIILESIIIIILKS